MKLVVLYPHARNKFLAGLILYQHRIEWVKVGQPIPRTPLLVTAGGDGTINYAVNNVDLEETRLIVLPLGRGNALSRILKLPLSMINEKHLERAAELEIPLMEANGRLAVFGAGMGKGSEFVGFANPYSQLGTPSYVASALKSIQTNRSYSICINGEPHHGLLTVEASVWGKIGFGLPLTWQGTPGTFLTLIRGRPLNVVVGLLLGQIPKWEGAITLSGDSFVLESDIAIPAHIDGETFSTKRLAIQSSAKRGKIIRLR